LYHSIKEVRKMRVVTDVAIGFIMGMVTGVVLWVMDWSVCWACGWNANPLSQWVGVSGAVGAIMGPLIWGPLVREVLGELRQED
jgi:hypothetical protein